jgi:hypothetical protein
VRSKHIKTNDLGHELVPAGRYLSERGTCHCQRVET